jgi:hypothetical protein
MKRSSWNMPLRPLNNFSEFFKILALTKKKRCRPQWRRCCSISSGPALRQEAAPTIGTADDAGLEHLSSLLWRFNMNRSRSIVRASSHLFALVLCVWFGSVAAAQVPTTYYVNASCGDDNWSGESPVCQSPDGPKATIQAAVNAASALDTIELADGTYSGAGNKNILIDKDLCIRSESLDPTLCIIDLEEDGRAFRIYGNTSIGLCLIEGITVENGYVLPSGGLQAEPMLPDDEGPEEGNGGAIELYSPATLKNCIFVRNKALRGAGGAIMIGGGGESRILSCVISSNESSFGGGIFAQSTDMSEVRDSVIQNNLAFSFGGGVMCYQYFGEVGRLALVKSIIDENTVGPSSFSNYPHSYGGGVMALTQCEVKIVNGIITNNQAFRSSGNGARLRHRHPFPLGWNRCATGQLRHRRQWR